MRSEAAQGAGTQRTVSHPPDLHARLASAARNLAKLALTNTDQQQPSNLIRSLARSVRECAALEEEAGGKECSGKAGAKRLLAMALSNHPPPEPDIELAELRLFARLNLEECAELLQTRRSVLAARWRTLRQTLFRRARRLQEN